MYSYKTCHFIRILKSTYLTMSVLSGLPIVTLSPTQTAQVAFFLLLISSLILGILFANQSQFVKMATVRN